MNKLNEAQMGYIAGFIDGEGCLSIYRHRRNTGHGTFNVTVRITNTNKPVLETIQGWTGLGRIGIRSPIKDFPYRKTQWEWTVNPNAIRELFPLVIPYLQIKKETAKLIMEFLGYKARVRGRHVTPIEIDRCDTIVRNIRQLNERSILKVSV